MRCLVLTFLALVAAESDFNPIMDKFKEFVDKFKKDYKTTEEALHRMKVFYANIQRIKEMQEKDESDSAEYSHMTPFADLTEEEFNLRNTLKMPEQMLHSTAADLSLDDVPSAWDWREKGVLNEVKNQAQCGSCWSFSTVCNIESANVVQGKGKLLSLSEQQLVDCDKATNDHGCNGGLPLNAYRDMIEHKFGLELEADYPYHAKEAQCQMDKFQQQIFINDWLLISKDEDQIAAALYKYGPLSIGIDASPMQMYKGGIADPWFFSCSPMRLNHAVNLVGYGSEKVKTFLHGEQDKKFWVIRNSWSTQWGEGGYYRLVRGKGKCGMNQMVTTAIINPKAESLYI